LFIHSSTLDSLIGGSESLSKPGMPLNVEEIKKDIKYKSESFPTHDIEIIKFVIENYNEEIHLDNSSIFEYESILKIIEKNKIEKDDYIEFGLFKDPVLESYSGKNLKDRIKENNKIFKEIDLSHQYGNLDEDFNDRFTDDIIDKLKSPDWKERIEYSEIINSIEKKSKDSKLTYLESKDKKTEENLIYWEVPERDTKAGRKKRNILIFNPNNLDEINVELKFEEWVKNDYILTKSSKKSPLTQSTSGKSLKINIKLDEEKFNFGSIKFGNNKEKYEFKFLILNIPDYILSYIKGKWTLKKGGVMMV
jgi:DNA phosphorothioation-dependent restriction protein DptH